MQKKIEDDREKVFNIIRDSKQFAYDVETTGLSWQRDSLIGYSFSDGKEAYYVATNHTGGGNIPDREQFQSALAKEINKTKAKIIGHNIKFDMHFSANEGVFLGNKVIDTQTTEALLDENRYSYSLGNVSKSYEITPKQEQELYDHISRRFSVPNNRKSMSHFHRLSGVDPIAVSYAAGDTLTTYQLWEKQIEKIKAEELDRVYDLECRLTYVLWKMEHLGIGVYTQVIGKVKDRVYDMLADAKADLPFGFNVNSKKDLMDYFIGHNITDWPVTELGNPSFNKKFLGSVEQGERLMVARKIEHFINSFIEPMTDHIFNNRIHCTFNAARSDSYGTVSGRLSSSSPNMQQVPKRDQMLGRIYRSMFIADKGMTFVEPDYSQAEPRLYAHYSNEPKLIEGYSAFPTIDMHQIVSDMMKIDRDNLAKPINLGMLYHMGRQKLADTLGISYDEADRYFKQWYRLFPNVTNFRKRAASVAQSRGYVKTILGRRRRFPDPRWAYKASNAVIQGGSADIIKYKMVEVNDWIERENLEAQVQMILTIHDALLFQVNEKDAKELANKITEILANVNSDPFNLRVPFSADYKYMGANWGVATYGEGE